MPLILPPAPSPPVPLTTLIAAVRGALTPELRLPAFNRASLPFPAGYCYMASEALYWLLGGKQGDWRPAVIDWLWQSRALDRGTNHWFLVNRKTGEILDITAEQFDYPIPYKNMRKTHWRRNQPSKRAQVVLDRIAATRTATTKKQQARPRTPA